MLNRKHIYILFLCLVSFQMYAQLIMEDIGRGLVVIDKGNGQVFAAWRFLGTDPDHVAFNLFRNDQQVNSELITNSANLVFTPSAHSSTDQYYIVAYINNEPIDTSAVVTPWSDFYKKIPLTPPARGTTPDGFNYVYHANDASVGDLDNDGEYEIVLKWQPNNAHDNAHSGYTGNTILEGLEFDGTSLWRIDLGINIRSGAHYNPFMVYDLDGDGIAEVACKTADGTKDSKGKVLGNATADYRNSAGYVLDGPEFLTIFNGQTGEEIVTTDYTPARGNVSDWGDNYGNRVDRFLATIAYLDGNRPSLVMCRGYYTRTVLAAYDFRDGELTSRWVFDSKEGYEEYEGQGAHSISVGDVDHDGKDEIMYGACAIDDDGSGLYNTGLRHGDATHLADIDPDEGGLEFYMVHETANGTTVPGMSVRNAGTGEMQWTVSASGDIGRGMTMDIIPDKKGLEVWSSDGSGVYDKDGNFITGSYPKSAGNGWSFNFGIWWDADLQREILDRSVLNKYNPDHFGSDRLLTLWQIEGASNNNGTKENPCLMGDLIGDWREEILMRNSTSTALIFFVNTDETAHKIRTLMHDPQYRLAIAWQNVGYNQPPHPSFYLGEGMEMPGKPNIRVAQACLNDLKVLPYGDYTGLELIQYGILEDLTDVDLPWGSSLLLFDEDNFEGGANIIRGTGVCNSITQPSTAYLSAIFSEEIFVDDVDYVIRSKANGQVLTVGEGAGEVILLADKSKDLHQSWNFERMAANEYAIVATHSDLMIQPELDLYWIQETPTNPVSDQQIFEIILSYDPRYFALRNKANGKCFEVDPVNGTLVCKTCDPNNQWQLFYEDVFSLDEAAIVLHGTKNDQLRLYPNPVEDLIQFQGSPVQSVKIFNLEGQLMLTRENLENNELNLSQLNPGMYLMSIDGRSGHFFTKILKN